MRWCLSHRYDPEALALANRHYNRQTHDSPQFVPPGRNLVFKTLCGRAVWVTLLQEHVQHAWPGAWVNSLFRNEGAGLSSELILEAVSASRAIWTAPAEGLVTFVDASRVRRKRDPGRCYRRAGFEEIGTTAGGLIVLRLSVDRMPPADRASARMPLFDHAGLT
jgi:hypothetical protein